MAEAETGPAPESTKNTNAAPAPTVGPDGKLLVHGGSALDDESVNGLIAAIEAENLGAVEQVVQKHGFGLSKAGFNALQYAAANRRGAPIVKGLLAKYAVDVNLPSTGKVFNFSWNEEYVLAGRVDESYEDDIVPFDEGLTAVQLAALSGSVHAFCDLLSAGSSLGPTKGGRTVQQLIAARYEPGGADSKKALAKALLEDAQDENEGNAAKELEVKSPDTPQVQTPEVKSPEQKQPGLIWSREQEETGDAGVNLQEFLTPKQLTPETPRSAVTFHMPVHIQEHRTESEAKSDKGVPVFKFSVQGQEGSIPKVGFGTAVLGPEGLKHIKNALKAGYRHIDGALLYGNQVEVGQAIKESGVKREEIFVTTKVSFFPGPGVWMYNTNNLKGEEASSIDLCLKQLGLASVDLLLIHNPCSSVPEYNASCVPHFFELFNQQKSPSAIPLALPGGENLRDLVFSTRRQRAIQLQGSDRAQAVKDARASRERSWKALELALKQGKCKYIGVANYSAELINEMKEYATVMPCVNQVEFHPRYASPQLQKTCRELGIVMTAYGSGNSVLIENNNPVVADIARRVGRTPTQVVLRWTLQCGVCVIPAAKSEPHMKENLNIFDFELEAADMALLNGLNQDYPYYWDPRPNVDTL